MDWNLREDCERLVGHTASSSSSAYTSSAAAFLYDGGLICDGALASASTATSPCTPPPPSKKHPRTKSTTIMTPMAVNNIAQYASWVKLLKSNFQPQMTDNETRLARNRM